jgi:hypothetical protein
MPDHKAITDPELHEPKGASTAQSGTVYVADGAGSGDWVNPNTNVGIEYATIYTVEGDSATLGSIGTTAQTLPFDSDGPNNGAIANQANNRITVSVAGDYQIYFSISFDTAASGDSGLYEFKVMDDGVATHIAASREKSGTNDRDAISVSGIVTLGAGSNVTVSVESDEAGDSDDITIYNSQLVVTLVRAS